MTFTSRLITGVAGTAMLLGVLAAAPSAEASDALTPAARAVSAASKTKCYTYNTHRACVVLHRNAKGRVWATTSIAKTSGNSNHRTVHLYLYSRACKATRMTTRAETRAEASGNATASSRTPTIAWGKNLYYQARVVVSWARLKRVEHGVEIHGGRSSALTTPMLSSCATP